MRVFLAVLGIFRFLTTIAAFIELCFTGSKVVEILNGIQAFTWELKKQDVEFPSAKRLLICNVSFLAVGSVMIALLAVLTVDGHQGSTVYAGFSTFAEATVHHHICMTQSLLFHENNSGNVTAALSPWARGTTALIIVLIAWWTLMFWTISYFNTFMWALTFWLLLKRFLQLMERRASSTPLLDVS